MSRIVGIGANVFDTLIHAPFFLNEDTKLESGGIKLCGGGPCATGLVAAAKLGAECAYIGNLANDASGQFLKADLERYGVSSRYIEMFEGRTSFSSYILINEQNASRTCVFYKGDVPPLMLNDAQKKAVVEADILMVDGNELDAAVEAAKLARESGVHVLYDAGGLYDGIERLLPYADILIPSEEFAFGHTGAKNAEHAAKKLSEMYSPDVVVITQGRAGGVLLSDGNLQRYPSFPVQAVDTNGAGDVFHGAFAFGIAKGLDHFQCCVFSSGVSAVKCTGVGARQSAPDYLAVQKFLKEYGYHEFEKELE